MGPGAALALAGYAPRLAWAVMTPGMSDAQLNLNEWLIGENHRRLARPFLHWIPAPWP